MKELQLDEPIKGDENQRSPKNKKTRPVKVITRITARSPTSSVCEIPILSLLFRAQEAGMSTRTVLQEVRSAKWFKLSDDDLKARYPKSRRKIVDSVIKYGRKNLVLKGQILPVGEGVPTGTWKATPRGLTRYTMEGQGWKPRYSTHDAIIIEKKGN